MNGKGSSSIVKLKSFQDSFQIDPLKSLFSIKQLFKPPRNQQHVC